MNIWVVTIYEPLPYGKPETRPQRCGMLVGALLENGHQVELWTSTFEHVRHKHYFRGSKKEKISDKFYVQYLDAFGYSSDYSPRRLLHNMATAKEFLKISSSSSIKPDIIFAPIPSLELAEAVIKFGSKYNVPVVVDIRDLWPDVYFTMVPSFFKFLNKYIFITEIKRAQRILSKASSITAISQTYLEWGLEYAQRKQGLYDNVFNLGFVSNNNQNIDQISNNAKFIRDKYDIGSNKLLFTFVGTFSDFYDIECILEAANALACDDRIHFMIVGSGENDQYYLNKAKFLKNVTMTGWVEFSEVGKILSATNVGLVAYSKIATMSLPNKPFEYMASRIPLLSSLSGELADIIKSNQIGKNYEAGNSLSLVSEILWFVDHKEKIFIMGENAFSLFENVYQSSKIYSRLALHIERIARDSMHADKKYLDDRKLKEIEHSDHRRSIVKGYEYQTDSSEDHSVARFVEANDGYAKHFSNMKFYSITKASFAQRDLLLYKDIKDAVALDYCCGNGEIAIEMAKRGASKVVGIDISEVAVKNAQELAKEQGVSDICEFKVMDAEHTVFEDNTFDIIHEYGALHHLELASAFRELSRILKPSGKLICTEALRHNPLIHWYRTRTPHLRTEWEAEHILGFPEIISGREFFQSLDMQVYHLAALAAVPFRKASFFKSLLSGLEAVDKVLLSIPVVRRLAWVAVVEYRKPIKASG